MIVAPRDGQYIKVTFATPAKGPLEDLVTWSGELKTWVALDGWVWPVWVKTLGWEH